MKKTVLIIFLLVSTAGVLFLFLRQKSPTANLEPPDSRVNLTVTSQTQPSPVSTSSTPYSKYNLSFIIVNDITKLKLYLNLTDRLSSKDAATQKSCLYLTSAGFYDTHDKPIGLLVSEGQILSKYQENKLFNGFLVVSANNVASISLTPPTNAKTALQAGPVIIYQGQVQKLTDTDSGARRIIAGITTDGKIVFMTFYSLPNPIDGPKLSELSQLIKDAVKVNPKLNVVSAINLDGGAHSAFINEVTSITELSTIGSYFCINP